MLLNLIRFARNFLTTDGILLVLVLIFFISANLLFLTAASNSMSFVLCKSIDKEVLDTGSSHRYRTSEFRSYFILILFSSFFSPDYLYMRMIDPGCSDKVTIWWLDGIYWNRDGRNDSIMMRKHIWEIMFANILDTFSGLGSSFEWRITSIFESKAPPPRKWW